MYKQKKKKNAIWKLQEKTVEKYSQWTRYTLMYSYSTLCRSRVRSGEWITIWWAEVQQLEMLNEPETTMTRFQMRSANGVTDNTVSSLTAGYVTSQTHSHSGVNVFLKILSQQLDSYSPCWWPTRPTKFLKDKFTLKWKFSHKLITATLRGFVVDNTFLYL